MLVMGVLEGQCHLRGAWQIQRSVNLLTFFLYNAFAGILDLFA